MNLFKLFKKNSLNLIKSNSRVPRDIYQQIFVFCVFSCDVIIKAHKKFIFLSHKRALSLKNFWN